MYKRQVPEPLGRRADFLLRVKGESMIDAGILDGDILVVQRAQEARNGEIVVALAGDDESADEATVKTFYREAGRARLPRVRDAPLRRPADPGIRARIRLAGRVTASPSSEGAEESPDTEGQGAGEIPGGESRRKVEQKTDRRRGILRRSRR